MFFVRGLPDPLLGLGEFVYTNRKFNSIFYCWLDEFNNTHEDAAADCYF